jgi:hypothetical protein
MFTDRGGEKMGETTQQQARTEIPCVASLRVDPDRLAQIWAMTPTQRLQAAQRGRLTLAEMLRWSARFPNEIPLVDGDFFFIAALAE